MKPENKPLFCKCGGKIVSAQDDWHKKKEVLICSVCCEEHGEVKKIYPDRRYDRTRDFDGKFIKKDI